MFILPNEQETKIAHAIDTVDAFLRDCIRRYSHLHDEMRRNEIARLVSEQICDAAADGLIDGDPVNPVDDGLFNGNSVDDCDDTVQLESEWNGSTHAESDSSIRGFRRVWSEIISDTVADQLG